MLEQTGVELTLLPRTFVATAEDVRLLSPFLEGQRLRYDAIRRPLLLITSDTDGVVPAWNHAERLIYQAASSDLVVLPGVGHGLHHVATERVVELVDDLARRVSHPGRLHLRQQPGGRENRHDRSRQSASG